MSESPQRGLLSPPNSEMWAPHYFPRSSCSHSYVPSPGHKSHLGLSEIAGISEDSAGFKKGEDLVGEFVVKCSKFQWESLA